MSDFDFLVGTWNVTNRALRSRLSGGDDWEVYPATATCRRLLDGLGILDEMTFPTKHLRAVTLRLCNVERREWSIYWATDHTGELGPPVIGGFDGERGDFYGDDTHDGKPIRVHFVWSGMTPTSARWQQAFSLDGGQTWETNWIMEWTRT